jgi:hypothetical protein
VTATVRIFVRCDGPGRDFHASTSVEAPDSAAATVALVRQGWQVLGEHHLCPRCAAVAADVAAER